MKRGEGMKRGLRQHYHWVVCGLVFLQMFVYGGIINSFNVFIIPLCNTLKMTRGDFSLTMIPYNIVCFFSAMFSGAVGKHLGYKQGALISLALAAGSTAAMGLAQTPMMLTVGRAVYACSFGMCFTAGTVMIIRNWFRKHQGLILGLITMSTGLGGSVFTTMLSAVTEQWGWRVAFFVKAGFLILIAVGYLFLLHDRPEKMGMKPYGFHQTPQEKKQTAVEDSRHWAGYPLKEQLRRPAMYVMCICLLISISCIYVTSTVIVPYFRDRGFSPAEAAGYQSVLLLALAVAKLISGSISDRFGAKVTAVVCILCSVLGQGILAYTNYPGLNCVAVVILAVGLCINSTVIPLLSQDLFGNKGSIDCNGIFLAMPPVAFLGATLITNYGYDYFGSYLPIFRGAAFIHGGTLLLFFVLFAMTKKDKAKFLAEHGK